MNLWKSGLLQFDKFQWVFEKEQFHKDKNVFDVIQNCVAICYSEATDIFVCMGAKIILCLKPLENMTFIRGYKLFSAQGPQKA